MTTQHYRITLNEAIEQYKQNWITSTALLYYYLKIRLAPKWKCTLHQKEISKKLGIPRSSFYRAIENLSKQGLINWETPPNGLIVSLAEDKSEVADRSPQAEREHPDLSDETPPRSDEISKDKIYPDDRSYEREESESSDENKTSPTDGKNFHEWDSIPTDEASSLTDEADSPTDETETSEKSRNNKTSRDPSNYYQIFITSLSNNEREKFFNLIDRKRRNYIPALTLLLL